MWNAISNAVFGPPKVPVTIVTGFLGSGKSTLLNYILTDPDHGMKFAIIENELGAVSIDDQLLQRASSVQENLNAEETIIEVTNGCICCSIRGDLVRALENLHPKILEHGLNGGILLETTGLADPAPIIQTFFQNPTISSQFQLKGVVTVVDAKHILARLNEEKPPDAVNEAVEQIAFADVILLNKVDLIERSEDGGKDEDGNGGGTAETYLQRIEEQIQEINPTVSIIRTRHSRVPQLQETVLQLQGFEVQRALDLDPEFLTKERKHFKDRSVSSVCCVVPGEVQLNLVQDWIRHLLAIPAVSANVPAGSEDHHHHHDHNNGDQHDHSHDHDHQTDHAAANSDEKKLILYRYKGILAVKGMAQKYVFQGVGMMFQGHFLPDLLWDDENEDRQSQFVFIGKNLKRRELQSDFEACLVTEELRFPIGSTVQIHVGEGIWRIGTVVAHWDQGNPYRIRLQEPLVQQPQPQLMSQGQQDPQPLPPPQVVEELWAPLDMDEFVCLVGEGPDVPVS